MGRVQQQHKRVIYCIRLNSGRLERRATTSIKSVGGSICSANAFRNSHRRYKSVGMNEVCMFSRCSCGSDY